MDVYEVSRLTLKDLISSGADIAVIGGWAIWAYNPYRYSMDIDIVLRPSDIWRIRSRLIESGFTETAGAHLGKKGFRKAVGNGIIEVDAYDERIGPLKAEDVLKRSVVMDLFGQRAKVASSTDLFTLKLVALSERRESWKGQKDVSDLIALLMVARKDIDVDAVKKVVPRKELRTAVSLLTSSYQQVARFFPLSMDEYKRLKSALRKWNC